MKTVLGEEVEAPEFLKDAGAEGNAQLVAEAVGVGSEYQVWMEFHRCKFYVAVAFTPSVSWKVIHTTDEFLGAFALMGYHIQKEIDAEG